MPRLARVVAVDTPHHVTQRGNGRRSIFDADRDRLLYLNLLQDSVRRYQLSLLGYCLMPNHVHLIVTPRRPDSISRALRHAHSRFSLFMNTRRETTGHLWQSRFYSCPMDENHLWTALGYTECNPVRAGIVDSPVDYIWSSARLHCGGAQSDGLIDLDPWRIRWSTTEWRGFLDTACLDRVASILVRENTRTGRPLGGAEFTESLEKTLGRRITPKKPGRPQNRENRCQSPLFPIVL